MKFWNDLSLLNTPPTVYQRLIALPLSGVCVIFFSGLKPNTSNLTKCDQVVYKFFKALSVGVTQESFDDIKKRVCEFIEYITMKHKVEYGAADLGDITPFLVKQVSHTRSISSIQSLAAVLKEHNSRYHTLQAYIG